MQETIEQILEYLKGIWLKRRYIIISTWLICPLSWVFITQMDDVYKSEARVFADTQSILGPLLKGMTVETNTDAQIQLMVRTLLSRPNLERISRMTDLDVQANTPKEYEELIEHLREGIAVRKTGGRRQNIFTISYEDKNAEMAKNVVQSTLTVFIENTIGENRTDTDSAQKFLNSQIKEYENRLLSEESKLTDFKQKYADVLPNQYGGYYDKLNIAKEQLKSMDLSLAETESQLKKAKTQLGSSSSNNNNSQNKILDFIERETGQIAVNLIYPSWVIYSNGFASSNHLRNTLDWFFNASIAFFLFLITWPVMLVTAILIKLDEGMKAPVFYFQERVGLDGHAFNIIKFRSMRIDAEKHGAQMAKENDDRTTKIGKFIRKYRVDELPQIYNVMRGDMGFVGPRPERPEFVQQLIKNLPYYNERHNVKPGLTGWAQLKYPYGSTEEDSLEKLKYDLYYIKHRSFMLDLLILIRTVEIVLFGKGR